MQPYLAMIVPVSGGIPVHPDQGLPGGGGRPDNSLPGGPPDHVWWGGRRPDHPDQGLPGSGAHPGNRPPGSGGGPVDPGWGGGGPDHPWWGGRPGGPRPDQGLPEGGAQPKMYAAAPESNIPAHPDKPDAENGEWVLVALGDRQMGWAWLSHAQAPEPKA